MGELVFYISLVLCFICYLARTSYHVMANRGRISAESKKSVNVLFVVMFFLWLSWFFMCFSDPYDISFPLWVRYVGLGLFAVGFSLFIISHLKISSKEGNGLRTSGIYSKIRHPMYFGFIIWIIGLPLYAGSPVTLALAIIWIPQILYWRFSEERQLEEKYPDYQEYKKKTWF